MKLNSSWKVITFVSVFSLSIGFVCVCRLDVYIHDYMVKKKLHSTAASFMTDGKVSLDHAGKNPLLKFISCGFLFQWELNSLDFICCAV